jgi:hypothetical protein
MMVRKASPTCTQILSFIMLLGYKRVYFHLPYRQTDRQTETHMGNDIEIVFDSTGIKVTNRGECIRHKWDVRRRGYPRS